MLRQEDLREVLARAEEIQNQAQTNVSQEEIDRIVEAAGEAGLSRQAVLQALKERIAAVGQPPQVGEKVFAKSFDGYFYPATVVSTEGELLRVRFVKGTDHTVRIDEIRPFAFLPGQKVTCKWPGWGLWTCTVVSYDAETSTVRVSDGWAMEQTFPVAEVRLPKERAPIGANARLLWMVGSAAASGGLIGALITYLLTR